MSAFPLNASAIRIEWGTPEYPNGVVTWYEIQYNLSHNDPISIPLSADSRRQAVICGLAPYTVYVFSVRAATGQQLKLWGNFTTRSERTKEAGAYHVMLCCRKGLINVFVGVQGGGTFVVVVVFFVGGCQKFGKVVVFLLISRILRGHPFYCVHLHDF